MKKTIIKYQLLGFLMVILGLVLTVGCEKSDNTPDEPGKNVPLYTPSDLTPKVMGTTVQLKWRGVSNTSGYEVLAARSNTFDNATVYAVAVGATTPVLTVENLSQTTNYWFKVRALASDQTYNSAYSTPVQVTTGTENILQATPKAISDVSITLQWTAGAVITNMVLTPMITGGTAQTLTLSENEKALGEKTLTNLSPETTYNVKLYNGANIRGEGEYTTLVRIMTPLTVTAVATPQSLDLTWAANEEVTHFILNPAPVTGSATVTLSASDVTNGTIMIDNLKAATTYTVAAWWNNSNRGSSTFVTESYAAATLTAGSVTDNAAVVAWTPADNYITLLNVRVTSAATNTAATYAVTSANAAGFPLSALTAGTNYTATLQYIYGGVTYTRGSTTFTTVSLVSPATLTVSDVLETAATIGWATTADASSVTALSVRPSAAATTTATYTAVTAVDATGKPISGLLANTNYTAALLYVANGSTYTRGSATFTTQAGADPRHVYALASGGDISAMVNSATFTANDIVELAAGGAYTTSGAITKAFTIRSASASNRATITLSGNAGFLSSSAATFTATDSVVFRDVNITGSGSYTFYVNSQVFAAVKFIGCTVSGFTASLMRVGSGSTDGTSKIDNLIIDNCVLKNMANNSGYALISTSGNIAGIANANIANSTIYNIGQTTASRGLAYFNAASTGVFSVNKCTFDAIAIDVSGNRNFVRFGASSAVTGGFTNCLFGKFTNTGTGAMFMNAPVPALSDNNYSVTDTDKALATELNATGINAAALWPNKTTPGNYTLVSPAPTGVSTAGDATRDRSSY